jgi:hypothetical protein
MPRRRARPRRTGRIPARRSAGWVEALGAPLADLEPGRGSSDLALALAESLRVLERSTRARCEVIFLTEGQRLAWRPDDSQRWELLRELHRRLPRAPELIALNFAEPAGPASSGESDEALGPLAVARRLLASGQPFTVTTNLYNPGRAPLHRRVEFLIDGRLAAGTPRSVGPVPPGGRVPLAFETAIAVPGLRDLRARIVDEDDANAADNEVGDVVIAHDEKQGPIRSPGSCPEEDVPHLLAEILRLGG